MSIDINGTKYDPRPLTMREVRKIRKMDEDQADITAIAWACGIQPAESEAWFDKVPMGVAAAAITEVMDAAMATDDAQFPVAATDDASAPR